MTNRKLQHRASVVLLIGMMAILGWANPVNAQAVSEQVKVTASGGANIRGGASTSERVLVTVPLGTVLPVIQRQGEWFLIRLTTELGTRAESGFIHQSTVQIIAAAEMTPAASPGAVPGLAPAIDGTPITHGIVEATSAGAKAGESKSATGIGVMAGVTSLMLPGAGLVYLAFPREVQPSFAEQAHLRDKSPDYVAAWTEGYDRALTAKQKRALYIGTAAGSAVSLFLIWGPLLSAM